MSDDKTALQQKKSENSAAARGSGFLPAPQLPDKVRRAGKSPWVCLSCGSNEPGPRMYYIQDTRSYCGNSVMWWRKNGEGYTSDLEKAWKVPGTWKGRDTDKLWPCDEIDKRATRQFDMQLFREIKP